MAWYRTGTVTVTNGSATVTGAGTDFVSNTQVGECFLGPDGRVYEIAAVVSSTQLTIIPAYQGSTAGAQAFGIQPTSSFARDLALGVGQLINAFASVRDGVGQGMFADGNAATPGIRFAADQANGLYRFSANSIAIATAGTPRMSFDGNYCYFNSAVSNVSSSGASLILRRADPGAANLILNSNFPGGSEIAFTSGVNGVSNDGFAVSLNGTQRLIIDASGNLLVGTSAGGSHIVQKQIASDQGYAVLSVNGYYSGAPSAAAVFFSVGGQTLGNAANAAVKFNKDATTNRSINAGGTINASGADYAEYMVKAQGCGTIAPGEVCGVDSNSHLTQSFAVARSFVIKSTDPAYVGGDTWSAHMPERPEQEDKETDAAYAARLTSWEQQLEAARQTVDRIAFSGQVPCNVAAGIFEPGDYIVAGPGPNDTIVPVVVKAVDMTFGDYTKRIGKVWRVMDDGRAWIDVQHG